MSTRFEMLRAGTAGTWWQGLLQDLRFGVRLLGRQRASTGIAILTLALGIGAATSIFSVVYGVLLRPLPYPHPERIVQLWEVDERGHRMRFADPNFADLRAETRSLQGLAEVNSYVGSVVAGSAATRTTVSSVSRDFFQVMGVRPSRGRGFAAEDQRPGAAPVALVSEAFWRRGLGGAAGLASATVLVDQRPTLVVGVLPRGFGFPDGAEVWLPRELAAPLPSRTAHNWTVVGRLRDGVPLGRARAELTASARRLARQHGRDVDLADVAAEPLREALTRDVRGALLLLLGAVGFLLLIACANVLNLLLAQLAARESELAVRAALGAARLRLVRQLASEALLLSLAGGLLGVLVAVWGVDALVALAPVDLPRLEDVSVNLPVLGFSFGLAVALAAALGILTAQRATGEELAGGLAGGGRGQSGAPASQRLARLVVGVQLALTLILLVGAGLLGRSLVRVLAVDPGFRAERIVTMSLALPELDSDSDARRRVRFLDDLLAGLRALPGVEEAGGASALPLTGGLADGTYLLMAPGEVPPPVEDMERLFRDAIRGGRSGNADLCVASAGYFRALGIPLLRGRFFDARDTMAAPHAALVSQTLARDRWPGQDPLGRTIEFGNMDGDPRLLTVVGVVGDVREASLETPPRPTIYVDYRQRPRKTESFGVLMRTAANPAALLQAARSLVRRLDPAVAPSAGTFAEILSRSLATRRFDLVLVGLFAGTALLLAMAGIYGVVSCAVARRTREVGVRIALGAQTGDVLRAVLGRQVAATAAGVAAGVAGALALTRLLRSLLFGVGAGDPATFAGVALLLAGVALLASYLPARRATRVDPVIALRSE